MSQLPPPEPRPASAGDPPAGTVPLQAPLHAPPLPLRTCLSLLVPLGAIVGLLLLVCAALLGGTLSLLAGEAGSRWLVQHLPTVRAEGFTGALLGPQWRVRRLRVEWDGAQQWLELEDVSAEGLRWTWRPNHAAWVALDVGRLAARKATLHTRPGKGPPPVLPQDLAPPVQVTAAQLRLDELVINALQPLKRLALDDFRIDPRPGQGFSVAGFSAEGFDVAVAGTVRLEARAPYALSASAALKPAGDGDVPRWAASLRAAGTLSGLALDATLRGRPLAGHGAQSLDLKAELRPLRPWPLASLDLRTQALDLSALIPKAPSTHLSGQAVLTGGADKTPLTASVTLSNATPGRWNEGRLPLDRLALELRGSLDRPDLVELSRFELLLADASRPAGRVRGSAVWQGHDVALEMQLTSLTPQRLDGRAAAMTLSGPIAASISGVPALTVQSGGQPPASIAWTLDLQGQLDAKSQAVRLIVEGSADDRQLLLKRARAQSGTASAELSAKVARSAGGNWQLASTGQVREFDPLPWWPGNAGSPWRAGPHRLSGDWQVDVVLPPDADNLPALTLLQRMVGNGALSLSASQLAGVPLSGEIRLGYVPKQRPAPATLRAELTLGGNQFTLDGRGDPTGSGASDLWRIEAKAEALAALAPLVKLVPTLAEWAPRQGTLSGVAAAEGRWPDMRTEGNVRLSQLAAGQASVARASATWRMTTGADQPQSLQLDMAGLALGARRGDNLRAELSGTLADHRLEVSGAMAVLPPALLEQLVGIEGQSGTRAQILARGAWQPDGAGGGRYNGQIERLQIGSWDGSSASGPPASGWAEARDLQTEVVVVNGRLVSVQANAGRIQVGDDLALRWDAVKLDLRGERPQLSLRAELEPFELAHLLNRLQPTMGWRGDLRLSARMDIRAAENLDADVVLERAGGDLVLVTAEGAQAMGLQELRLAVTAHDGQWRFAPVLRGRRIGEAAGAFTVQTTPDRRWPEAEAPIAGEALLQVADIGSWSAWVPPGWRLAGAVKGTARISGTFGEPRFNGTLGATGLAVRNLLQGVNITDGQVAVRLDGQSAQIERFTLRGGDGFASISGGATFGREPQARLKFTAERFRVLGRVDRMVTASGTADIELLQDQARVGGNFTLDEVLFDGSRSDKPTLDDDVVVRRPGQAEDRPAAAATGKQSYPWFINLGIDLGEKTRFKGWGLDTGLRGSLQLTAPSGRLAMNGTINAVNGTFANYGQKLAIERGVVAFSGPLGNPRLDVLALRPNVDNVRVGVTLTGNLLTMRVRLYSDPDMSDNDKLAWLMLGRAPDTLGRNETALLQRAAVALLSGDGEAPTDALMKSLGIDDVSLRQSDTDVRETVISVGKQLSQRWYLGYERGVNATTGTWQLIYRLAQRLTVRMQSGQENALDVIWTWRFQETPLDAGMRKSTIIPP